MITDTDHHPSRLFVYGTLQPGHLRWPFLAPFALDHRAAAAPGRLYDSGCGWPVALFEAGEALIPGTVADLDPTQVGLTLRILDEVEATATNVLHRTVITTLQRERAWAYECRERATVSDMTQIARWDSSDER